MKNDRLFRLLYLLMESPVCPAEQLARALEVSVRTVYRDVETLSMAGVPVRTVAGRGGGVSLMPGYTMDKALLSDSERRQLMFALQSMEAAGTQTERLLQKLQALFGAPRPQWIEVDFSRWGRAGADTALFAEIRTAILQRREAELCYYGASGRQSRRRICPLKLIYKEKNWYLQAFCLTAQDYRLFKLSRIARFSLGEQFFPQTYEQNLPPVEVAVPPQNIVRLRLRLASALAYRVYDEFEPDKITPQPDGSFEVQAEYPMDEWVIGYLLTFGTQAEVLEPPALRAQLAERAKNIYEHYKP